MRLAFILLGLQSLSIAFDRPKLLVQRTLINVTDNTSSNMFLQIVNCGSAARHSMTQVNQFKFGKLHLIGKS